MKNILLSTIATLLFVAPPLSGQDLIVKRDAEKIEARVVAITDSVITYRLSDAPDAPDAPVHNIVKAQVRMILWENGDQDDFGKVKKVVPRDPSFDYSTLGGELSIINNRVYTIGGTRLTRAQMLEYMAPYPDIVKTIKAGRRMKRAGIVLGSIGGFFLTAGAVCFIVMDFESGVGIGYTIAGTIIGGTGLGLGLGSVAKQNKALSLYNESYVHNGITTREVRLSLAPTYGGVGLQLNF